MQRLSRTASDLPHSAEIVVIGTGYGGAIAASRLARAGRQVVVLERGRELHPGEYPNTLAHAAEEMQVEFADHHVGRRSALFSLRAGEMNVFHGCGLGGTSLINANVSLRPDDDVLDDERWPESLRKDRDGLDMGYARATEMLRPERYPDDMPHLAKLDALRRAAGTAPFERTPINVTFRSGPNVVGVQQEACNGCGDCVTGCNVGAKNTLLMNYLPDAVGHGAEIFTEVEVRDIERDSDHWLVHYQPVDVGRENFDAPPLAIQADIVVVAAGVLGTAEILFRSRAGRLPMSDRLGHQFTGNGDVLGFAYNTLTRVNGIGSGDHEPSAIAPPGPCITGIAREVDRRGPDGHIVLEDGVIPGALAPLLPLALAAGAGSAPRESLRAALARFGRTLESLVFGPRYGADNDSLTFLVMGDDDDAGRLTFDGEQVSVAWPGVGTSSYYEAANARLKEATALLGGEFIPSPTWHAELDNSVVTVHPLGGCVMADRAEEGVVDDRGRVFSGTAGTEVHDGLYVLDGSIVPRPLGLNPLLTISALAERNIALLAAERGWDIDWTQGPVDLPERGPARIGLEFSESMSGFFSTTVTDSYEAAATEGQAADTPMRFVLTLATEDLSDMLDNPGHRATATGTVECLLVAADPITVTGGTFRLFVTDEERPDTRTMRYELPLVTDDGRQLFFEGIKYVHPSFVTEAWAQTTTLYVTVYEGTDSHGAIVGRGILRIPISDFARQLRSMRVTNAPNEEARLAALARFGGYFAGVMWDDYGGVLHGPTMLRRDAPPRVTRPLSCGVPDVHAVTTADGVTLRLSRYCGGSRGPVVVAHGMGASSRLFSTDTVSPNLTEYLYAEGFDVWLFDWRGSPLLPASFTSFTGDTVGQFDYPAAEAVVRQVTGTADLHWIVHCVGSITFFMSLLRGSIDPKSVAALQVAVDTIPPLLTGVKINLHLAAILRALGLRSMTTDVYSDERWIERRLDDLLALYPVPSGERCTSAVCHRVSFLYGLCWQHEQLSEATHEAVHEMFGISNLEMMSHLARCSTVGHLVGADGAEVYLPNLDRLQIPISLFHGDLSHVWKPASTAKTYERLVAAFGPDNYRRVTFPRRGHLDPVLGRDAHVDVYPALLAHLNRAGA